MRRVPEQSHYALPALNRALVPHHGQITWRSIGDFRLTTYNQHNPIELSGQRCLRMGVLEDWNSLSGHELARPGSITYVEADAPVEF